ncbi:hemolysin family protein [uncultured Flavobacterium sp.]|uniref:hemolysin family protein n=1 Tax=uncultured Flavobacterium sp. TaxID=165435 RepID=UPI0025D9ABF3|nr:hemolysin family protein [uncultured Flavobacterium sp.]
METAVIIVCLLLSAFFSGMEIAYVSSNKVYLEVEKKQPDIISKILTRLTEKPALFMVSMLAGNSIALVVYGYYMGSNVLQWVYPSSGGMHIAWQLLLQIVISSFIILLTAEFIPKIFFQVYANRLIKVFALPAYVFYCLFNGVSKVIIALSDFILVRILGTKGDTRRAFFTRGELGTYLNEQLDSANSHEVIDPEIQIFRNALGFSGLTAREVMTPHTEIAAIELNDDVAELRQLFIDTGYSKIVVYENDLNGISGYVHSFEMFKNPKTVYSGMTRIERATGNVLIKDLLDQLTRKRKSMAVILNDDGSTAGIVTIEDIIEELFGEIEDEHDLDEQERIETALPGGGYVFSASLGIEYINERYKLAIPVSESYNSLGGFMVFYAGQIPKPGNKVVAQGFELTVEQASAKIITLVKVVRIKQE